MYWDKPNIWTKNIHTIETQALPLVGSAFLCLESAPNTGNGKGPQKRHL